MHRKDDEEILSTAPIVLDSERGDKSIGFAFVRDYFPV